MLLERLQITKVTSARPQGIIIAGRFFYDMHLADVAKRISDSALISSVHRRNTRLEQLQASPKSKLVLVEVNRDACAQDDSSVLRATSTRKGDARIRGMRTADSMTAASSLASKRVKMVRRQCCLNERANASIDAARGYGGTYRRVARISYG
jgi:hypothetical protein